MRQKMRDHLLPNSEKVKDDGLFAVKQGIGGIVDIEFMVQYAVLAWSCRYPSLAVYSDNIRILEALQKESLFSEQDVQALSDAYKDYRVSTHRLSLQEQDVVVDSEGVATHREAVQKKWQQLMSE